MDAWWLVGIAVAVIVLIVLLAVAIGRSRRSMLLRRTFGPEYDRAVEENGRRRHAEAALEDRLARHDALELRPLSDAARERYRRRWEELQQRFVDDPVETVRAGQALIVDLMRERGYLADGLEERIEYLSVDHPERVGGYRRAHEVTERPDPRTEDLREAMVSLRDVFDGLLGDRADVHPPRIQEVR